MFGSSFHYEKGRRGFHCDAGDYLQSHSQEKLRTTLGPLELDSYFWGSNSCCFPNFDNSQFLKMSLIPMAFATTVSFLDSIINDYFVLTVNVTLR